MSDHSSPVANGSDRFSLVGRTAVVTGGNGGIGFAIATALAQAGAAVVIAGRNEDKNAAAASKLVADGARAIAVRADVTLEDDCRRLMDEGRRASGGFDILVNNAGTNIRKQPEDYGLDEWRMLIEVNLGSVYMTSLAAFPILRERGGKIINIGSMTSIFGASFSAPYGASKGGVVQLTKALASAWARYGIQVNSILPGWIETDLTLRGRSATPDLHQQVIDRTPAGRWGKPDDLGGAAVFLASRASDFVTGAALPVDGGYSVQA